MSKQKQAAALAATIKRFGSIFIRVSSQGARSERDHSKQEMLAMAMLDLDGASRMGTMARNLGVSQGAITPLIDRLEKRGFVQRRRSTDDRRVWVAELTDDGRKVVAEKESVYQATAEALLAPLDNAERSRIIELLEKLDHEDGKGG